MSYDNLLKFNLTHKLNFIKSLNIIGISFIYQMSDFVNKHRNILYFYSDYYAMRYTK